jgi:crotonobetainyl-CoA:carnitine CoA-transferase CaiB-like acyl-CoA transferase
MQNLEFIATEKFEAEVETVGKNGKERKILFYDIYKLQDGKWLYIKRPEEKNES